MVKPGVAWDPTKAPEPPALLSVETSSLTAAASAKKRGHSRIPSVVLSTPSSPLEKPQDIQLVDADGFTFSAEIGTEPTVPQSTYRTTVSQPEYWEKLLAFLRYVNPCAVQPLTLTPIIVPRSQFPAHPDSSIAFEDYLAASKAVLTASEIAKIRDHVGVVGMAGT